MAYIKTIMALLMAIVQILAPVTAVVFNGGEKAFFEDWSAEQVYTDDYAVNLEKEPGKDFVVLNLTDVQLEKWEAYAEKGEQTTETIDYLIKKTNPDLITLTGDNAWSTSTYLKLIEDIDAYGIPWAPVMGNHDGSCCINEFWCAYEMAQAENCIFKFGPKNMGYGNYIINIKENGRIVHTLFMMDTHSDIQDENNINGAYQSGYDNLWANQLEWYEWAVKGIKSLAGYTVPSSVFIHIPLVEFKTAYDEAYDVEKDCFKPLYAMTSFGKNLEGVCCAPQNNGFFSLCQRLGSTHDIIAGHDHVNYSSILYQGIRLTYSLKCGAGGYWEEGISGGTTLSINSLGLTKTEHVFAEI